MTIAKASVPELSNVVPRERLFTQLDAERGRPLVWIGGPPGSGKTTLAASYLEARGLPVLWYRIDEGDDDPAEFFHHLAAAAGALLPAGTLRLPRLRAEHLPDPAGFARLFCRQLCGQLPEATVFVFDDYQTLTSSGPFHGLVRVLAGERRPQGTVMALSRSECPDHFVDLHRRGGVAVLGPDELRMNLDETRLVCELRGIRDEAAVRRLFERADGWAAGLTLMCEQADRMPLRDVGPGGAPPESLFRDLADPLFENASAVVRSTLLSVVFLGTFPASAAAVLSGRPKAGRVLECLDGRGLFTHRLGRKAPVFRLHALLREFLEQKLAGSRPQYEVYLLRQRSADILAEAGDVRAAIQLRAANADWAGVGSLIREHAVAWGRTGRRITLVQCLGKLPLETVQASSELTFWSGLAASVERPLEGIASLERARAAFAASGDTRWEVRALLALLGIGYLGHQAATRCCEWLDRLEAVEAASSGAMPDVDWGVRWPSVHAVLFCYRPWNASVIDAPTGVLRQLQSDRTPVPAAGAVIGAITLSTDSNRLDLADSIVTAAESRLDRAALGPIEVAWLHQARGSLRFSQGRHEEAIVELEVSEAVANAAGLDGIARTSILNRHRAEVRACGWPKARETLATVEAGRPSGAPLDQAMLAICRSRLATAEGAHDRAAREARESMRAVETLGTAYHIMSFGLYCADALIRNDEFDDADRWLDRSEEIVRRSPILAAWQPSVLFIRAFRSLRRGDAETARRTMGEALSGGKAGHRRMLFRDFECAMPALFSLALREGIEVELVVDLIRRFRIAPPEQAPETWPRAVRIVTLGRFEVEVQGRPVTFADKVPKGTLNLLQALVAYGRDKVPERWLCEALWRGDGVEPARQALAVTVLRLRKLLGVSDAVIQRGGEVWLDPRLCSADAWRFEARCAETEAWSADAALSLYQGEFLPGEASEPWTLKARERLRGRFLHVLEGRASTLEAAGSWEAALALYERGFDTDPVDERFHLGAMRCCRALGRPGEAVAVFRRARQVLLCTLGVGPSETSIASYQDILADMRKKDGVPPPGGRRPRGPGRLDGRTRRPR